MDSLFYHIDFLEHITKLIPNHKFNTIPILNRRYLLKELQPLITKKSSSRIPIPTGIPSHVETMVKLEGLIYLIQLERRERKDHYKEITDVISSKIEEISKSNGQITHPAVENLFEDFSSSFTEKIGKQNEETLSKIPNLRSMNNFNLGMCEKAVVEKMKETYQFIATKENSKQFGFI